MVKRTPFIKKKYVVTTYCNYKYEREIKKLQKIENTECYNQCFIYDGQHQWGYYLNKHLYSV